MARGGFDRGSGCLYVHDNRTKTGFVMAADEGQAFWFLNTLTINKVGSDAS